MKGKKMGNESGTWIMYGVSREDPECIHTVDEAVEYINKVGFLPLFKNEIPGFHWKSALLRNIGGAAIQKAIPGNGVRSLPEAVKSPMENFLIRKRVYFKAVVSVFCKLLGGTDMILMRFGMMKRHPSGKRKSWISI